MNEDNRNNVPEEMDDDIIEIIDETGTSMPYKILADCEWNDNIYILLEPQFDTGDPDEVMIFRVVEEENDEITLLPLETEEEAKNVFEEFKNMLAEDEFDFDIEK